MSKLGMRPTLAFQSTLPGWGATRQTEIHAQALQNFNPRSPDGERRAPEVLRSVHVHISIHAPRMGSDDLADLILDTISRISIHAPRMGSDAGRGELGVHGFGISIHAPRMGSDSPHWATWAACSYFNPRSPDGERRPSACRTRTASNFNPRSPDGERPAGCRRCRTVRRNFNPRSPDGERRSEVTRHRQPFFHFNPRSPDGERLPYSHGGMDTVAFQSTLPGWGATGGRVPSATDAIFQSTLPGWGATVLPCVLSNFCGPFRRFF